MASGYREEKLSRGVDPIRVIAHMWDVEKTEPRRVALACALDALELTDGIPRPRLYEILDAERKGCLTILAADAGKGE